MLEFVTYTKGMEYLIAIAFLCVFVAFWLVIQRRGKGMLIRLAPLGVITIALVFGTATCAIENSPSNAEKVSATETPLVSTEVLVEMYGPADFDHEAHQRSSPECDTCHHFTEDTYPSCSACHEESRNPDELEKPCLTNCYHMRCIGCHVENQVGYTECLDCHTKADVTPLSITHPLTGEDNCIGCHGSEIAGVPPLPDDHTQATNGVCRVCHLPAVEPSAVATRVMPHKVTGMENCLMCHGTGIGNASKVPDDHAGETNDTCQICHQVEAQ